MNTRLVLYPYKLASESGKKVAEALDALRVKVDGEYVPKAGDFIVDWGNGHTPQWAGSFEKLGNSVRILNHWNNVCLSVNKIETFERFKKYGVPHPAWTFNKEQAQKWANQGHWVCCRQQVEGMDGDGLVLAKNVDQIVPSHLYTKYMPILKEFRVYVLGDEMLDIREKRRDSDALKAGKVNEYIRTTSGNWVFCQYGITTPKDAQKVAVDATKSLGLDFAGVDIIQAKEDGKCYALETNTAPYIGDNTVAKLVKAIATRQKEFIVKQSKWDW